MTGFFEVLGMGCAVFGGFFVVGFSVYVTQCVWDTYTRINELHEKFIKEDK